MSEPKARPIIMSGWSVQRILAAEKTQTRRPIKPQAHSYNTDILDPWVLYPREDENDTFGDPSKPIRCPYGKPGDLLYVKETWGIPICLAGKEVIYKADYNNKKAPFADGEKWKSSRFMPKSIARIFLRIKDIRVERLQDISEEDAIAEGVPKDEDYPVDDLPCPSCGGFGVHGALAENLGVTEVDCVICDTPRKRFAIIWNSIYAKTFPWETSPWVWAIDFIKEKRT